MTFVVTQNCCSDASCIDVCPVDCIRPAPGDPAFGLTEMVYIDPGSCIDCGACQDACPVDAVYGEDELPAHMVPYAALNARYFEEFPLGAADYVEPGPGRLRGDVPELKVAIVGSGPAGMYAAQALLGAAPKGAMAVTVVDRLPTPWGLVRAGVAPDHQATKKIAEVFEDVAAHPHFDFLLNVEVGTDVSHADLAAHYDAVIYAIGAQEDRGLALPGAELPGVTGAASFVAWYNGHPDHAAQTFDLSGDRAVIVGNGNVALDVARILLAVPEALARTDMADHALAALRNSNIREVVVVARRGPAETAFASTELLGLINMPGVEIAVEPDGVLQPEIRASGEVGFDTAHKLDLMYDLRDRGHGQEAKRLVLRFLVAPTRFVGTDRVTAVELALNESAATGETMSFRPTGETELLDAGLVVTAVGYRGSALPGLPFDREAGTIPTDEGRVVDPATGVPLRGVYATGWIRRGPSGGIGANARCARDTVAALLDDAADGLLTASRQGFPEGLRASLVAAGVQVTGADGWASIDRFERQAGTGLDRPRVKLTGRQALLAHAIVE